MRDEDLARVVKADMDEIVPSSGFAASVMEAVRLEAATPPPIPFPWTRAVPGLAAAALTLVSVFVLVIHFARAGVTSSATQLPTLVRSFESAGATGAISAIWIAVASLLAVASVRLAMRMAGART